MARNGFAPQRLLFVGAGGLLALVTLTFGYYRWANIVPPFQPPRAAVPQPNGFDRITWAANSLHRVPGVPGAPGAHGSEAAFDPSAPLPVLNRALSENRAALAEARRALALPYQEPPQYGFDARFPHYAKLRELARGFSAESRVLAAKGRPDEAAEAALDAMQLGSKVGRGGPLIGGLVAIAVHAIGYAALEPL